MAALDGLIRRQPAGIARHAHRRLHTTIRTECAAFRPDVIHVEQLQALAMLGQPPWPAPVILRMQNVESDLWAQWPASPWVQDLLRIEGDRMATHERRSMAHVAHTLAITDFDMIRLRSLYPELPADRTQSWTVPFPSELPAGAATGPDPVLVTPQSTGWGPNRQAADWVDKELVDAMARCAPNVSFWPPRRRGGKAPHAPAAESIDLFPANAIVAIPLFVGSGIRMRILEAWARGLPVVATKVAALGLDVRHGGELLIADDATSFATSVAALAASPDLRASLVARGRAYLRAHHDPATQGERLMAHYRHVCDRVAA